MNSGVIISDEDKGGVMMMMTMQEEDGIPITTSSQMQDDDDHPPPPHKTMRYKECLKNHAASLGGNAVDGCGEFLPPSTSPPAPLYCSACGCHRNFHRKELADPITTATTPAIIMPPIMHARSTSHNTGDHVDAVANGAVEDDDNKLKNKKKRRFRTKFSKEQKEKLGRFGERAGWKMKRVEGGVVEEFCREIGIQRKVLKVWMHNNKHKYSSAPPSPCHF